MSGSGPVLEGTTIVAVRRGGKVVLAGDGQVTFGGTVLKGTARKLRRLYEGRVVVGFAGGTADAFTLFERFEDKHRGVFVLWDGFFGRGQKPTSSEVRDLVALALVGGGKTDAEADKIVEAMKIEKWSIDEIKAVIEQAHPDFDLDSIE